MQHTTGALPGTPPLFWRLWRPDAAVVASVALVHGIHEHSGRYAYMASRLMLRGIEVHAFDYRGHGQSGGARGQIETWGDYHEDLDRFAAHVQRTATPGPRFLMGHSLGGLISAGWWADRQPGGWSGLILSSPALALPPVNALLHAAAPHIARWMPRLAVGSVDPSLLSRDERVGEQYLTDPHVIASGVQARTGWETLRASERLRADYGAIDTPLYLFHGTDDQITLPSGSEALADAAAADDVTLRLWRGLRHETMNEPERDEVIDAVADWILERA